MLVADLRLAVPFLAMWMMMPMWVPVQTGKGRAQRRRRKRSPSSDSSSTMEAASKLRQQMSPFTPIMATGPSLSPQPQQPSVDLGSAASEPSAPAVDNDQLVEPSHPETPGAEQECFRRFRGKSAGLGRNDKKFQETKSLRLEGIPNDDPDWALDATLLGDAYGDLVISFRGEIDDFIAMDMAAGGAAVTDMPTLIGSAYPSLRGETLQQQLLNLAIHVVACQARSGGTYGSLEYWAGSGAITASQIKAGVAAAQFDKNIDDSHNCTTAVGFRLWLDTLSASKELCLTWFGTQCSPFVWLSSSQHGRKKANGFLGNTDKAFVKEGNSQMLVTATLFLLAYLVGNRPVLEQPQGSCLPKICPLSTVLRFAEAFRTVTHLGAFGASSAKPLQLYHTTEALKKLRRKRPDGMKPLTLEYQVSAGQSPVLIVWVLFGNVY